VVLTTVLSAKLDCIRRREGRRDKLWRWMRDLMQVKARVFTLGKMALRCPLAKAAALHRRFVLFARFQEVSVPPSPF
jgi:hypothetical protein